MKTRTVKIYQHRKFIIVKFDTDDYIVMLKSNIHANTVEYNADTNIIEVVSDSGNTMVAEEYDETSNGDLLTYMMDLCLNYEDEDWGWV